MIVRASALARAPFGVQLAEVGDRLLDDLASRAHRAPVRVGLAVLHVTGGVDIGLGINDTVNDDPKFPKWGAFASNHEYTIDFVGLGAAIGVNFHDCTGCYGDNIGFLTVEIFAPAEPVPTLTQWAQIFLLALLVGSGLWTLRRRRVA